MVILAGCSGGESVPAESIGQRLHRECVSIINTAMGVEGGIDLTGGGILLGSRKAEKAVLIQDCILQRGGMKTGAQ